LLISNIVTIVKAVTADTFKQTWWEKSGLRWCSRDVADDGLGRLGLGRLGLGRLGLGRLGLGRLGLGRLGLGRLGLGRLGLGRLIRLRRR
jgi:hypothetical protein